MKRTVGELLFEGYADTIMEIADSLDEDDFDFDEEEQEKVKMDKFGWFYQVSLTLNIIVISVHISVHYPHGIKTKQLLSLKSQCNSLPVNL